MLPSRPPSRALRKARDTGPICGSPAHGQVRDQRHCQHVAHAHADAETKPQQLEVNAFGMQAAARPGIEQIARNRQQCKRQQAGNEQFELVGTLTQSAEARCRFQYWIDLGNRRVRLSQG
ncbi:hypothetical protein G6F50_016971 [Rhizopus delemar]|uniref:Uncharacterized protein n=1 Tax=Rhizopus delemar TaxID=936053 RepID=A0A9P6XRY7_9FUNG|nr:hypothetical protein G6F50_016971 [Rhizopus delemar]